MNFVKLNIAKEDMDMFFGPIDPNDTFFIIQDHWTMAHIIHKAGIFPSISQAKKNGWNKPIPVGFTILTIGKKAKKRELFIFS
jgi:hypothetical protein